MGDDSSARKSPVAEYAADGARASAEQTPCSSAARQPRVMGETTPLFSAAQRGELAEVERILSVSPAADLETKDEDGSTPLMEASCNGHMEVVEALARAGADKEAKDENGYTPLMMASL